MCEPSWVVGTGKTTPERTAEIVFFRDAIDPDGHGRVIGEPVHLYRNPDGVGVDDAFVTGDEAVVIEWFRMIEAVDLILSGDDLAGDGLDFTAEDSEGVVTSHRAEQRVRYRIDGTRHYLRIRAAGGDAIQIRGFEYATYCERP